MHIDTTNIASHIRSQIELVDRHKIDYATKETIWLKVKALLEAFAESSDNQLFDSTVFCAPSEHSPFHLDIILKYHDASSTTLEKVDNIIIQVGVYGVYVYTQLFNSRGVNTLCNSNYVGANQHSTPNLIPDDAWDRAMKGM